MPKVTVLLPVRNAAPTLEEAVQSILCQTLKDIELIAVDDGSSDGSLAIMRRLARSDGRVRVMTQGPLGIVAALNAGLGAASSALVARMDADDRSHPERLERQIALAEARRDLAVVGCLVECVSGGGLTDGMRQYEQWLNSVVTHEDVVREIFVESPFAHPSVLLRRDAVLAVGGYRAGPFPEDYDLWLRLYAAGYRMAKVPLVLLEWRDGPHRLSRTDPRYSVQAFRRLKAEYLTSVFLKGQKEVQMCGAGPLARAMALELYARGVRVVRHLDVDPRKVGRRLKTGAVVVHWSEVRHLRDMPMVCAVGQRGARPRIRAELVGIGFQEGVDFVFVQ